MDGRRFGSGYRCVLVEFLLGTSSPFGHYRVKQMREPKFVAVLERI